MAAHCQRETCGPSPPDLARSEVVNLLGRTYTHLSEVGRDCTIIAYFENSLPNEVILELYLNISPYIDRG